MRNQEKKSNEFIVYSRKNPDQRRKKSTLQQHQEPNPRTDPISVNPPNKSVFESNSSNSQIESINDLDVPIAHRNGTRQCTKHHLSNFMSYEKLPHFLLTFTSQLSIITFLKIFRMLLMFLNRRKLFLKRWSP